MNKKGQALLETLFTSAIWSLGLIFLIRAAFSFGETMLLDELTDEFLLCRNPACEKNLQYQLNGLRFTNIEIARPEQNAISLSADSRLHGRFKIRKETTLAAQSQ